jgi:excisionase family DNA binding protein
MTHYTTKQAARQLHVSFVTVKRWVYSGKIRASKNSRGWWCIEEEEIARLRAELSRRSSERINEVVVDLVFSKGVAYLRELQVCLEEEYLHEDTYAALQRLCSSKLNTAFEIGNRWYFPRSKQWSNVQIKAIEKNELMNTYVSHPRRYEKEGVVYMDYSEYPHVVSFYSHLKPSPLAQFFKKHVCHSIIVEMLHSILSHEQIIYLHAYRRRFHKILIQRQ